MLIRFYSLLIAFSCFYAPRGFAQKQPSVAWQKALGGADNDFGVSAAPVIENGFPSGLIILGTTLSSNGDVSIGHGAEDIWLIKLTPEGEIVWEKTYGDGRADIAGQIVPAGDGGFIVGGSTWPLFVPPTDTNNLQWWIFKVDSLGNMLWEKKYGGSSPDNLVWLDMSADGSIYCAGHSTSKDRDFPENKGNYDIWVWKLTSTGDVIWKKTFGGSDEDRAAQIRATNDGGCIIAGRTKSTDGDMSANHGGTDGFIAKLSSGGNVEWTRVHGTVAADAFNAVVQLASGGYAAAGFTQGAFDPNGDYDVLRLDADGNTVWEKFYGGSARDEATALLEVNGGLQVLGTSASVIDSIPTHRGLKDWLVYRLDVSGNNGPELFSRWFGGFGDDDAGSTILPVLPGYVAVGRTNSNDDYVTGNHGNFDVWVVRYGGGVGLSILTPFIDFGAVDTGKSTTRELLLQNGGGEPLSIELTVDGPGAGQFTIENYAAPFTLGAKTDTTFIVRFAPTSIGVFNDTLRVRSSLGQSLRVMLRGEGAISSKVGDDGVELMQLAIYPNPASGTIVVAAPAAIKGKYFIRIENTLGEALKTFVVTGDTASSQFDIRDLPAGIYTATLYEHDRILARQKFVKK